MTEHPGQPGEPPYGQQPPPPRRTAPATAAWMTLASMMLNLDEAITLE